MSTKPEKVDFVAALFAGVTANLISNWIAASALRQLDKKVSNILGTPALDLTAKEAFSLVWTARILIRNLRPLYPATKPKTPQDFANERINSELDRALRDLQRSVASKGVKN